MLKIRLLVISLTALCLSTAPASANLFDFEFDALASSYDGGSGFSTSANKILGPGLPLPSSGSVTGFKGLTDVAEFDSFQWVLGGDFSLSMSISSITATSAYGEGSFVITDAYDGDTITGNIAGTWIRMLDNVFIGEMSNVEFIDTGIVDGSFDGHSGSVQMDFISSPWEGTLIELSSGGNWFTGGFYETYSGGVLASVSGPQLAPVPAAVVLGIIGLGVAGLKLRKYA